MRNDENDLVAAPVTPLVLTVLAEGESYGFAIIQGVRQAEGREGAWSDAMVYPLLHRLRRLGHLTAEWRVVPDGRRRRYYAITEEGRAELARLQRQAPTSSRSLTGRRRSSGWRLAVPVVPAACLAA